MFLDRTTTTPTTLTTPTALRRPRPAALAGAAALVVALAACSPGTGTGSTAGGSVPTASGSASSPEAASASSSTSDGADHDEADVTFAQQMVVHHEAAIAMADLAPDRAGDQRVKDLAARIRAAQAPEVEQMTSWLQTWGQRVPDAPSSPSPGSMTGMDHSSTDPTTGGAMGMMTQEQADRLSAASGTAFDRMFLQMMVVHHQGAIDMARQEQSAGASPQAKALAASVITSQSAEIVQMQQILTSLG